MNNWALFFIIATFSIFILVAIVDTWLKPQHSLSVIEENSKELRTLIENYGDSNKFEIHHVSNLEKPYARIEYIVNYRRSFRNTNMKEISREIIHVDYYIQL